MTDRMSRKTKMLGNRFAFILADITFVSVHSFSDTVFPVSPIHIALRQSKQESR